MIVRKKNFSANTHCPHPLVTILEHFAKATKRITLNIHKCLMVGAFRSVLNLNPREEILHALLRPHSNTCAREDWQSPPLACASKSYWSPPQNISSRTNISQPQSVSGPITATQRHRVQPDRAATSTDMNLSEQRISADNIARCPPLQTPNCLLLKIANPDRAIDLFALLNPVISFLL